MADRRFIATVRAAMSGLRTRSDLHVVAALRPRGLLGDVELVRRRTVEVHCLRLSVTGTAPFFPAKVHLALRTVPLPTPVVSIDA
jgi:hypothetical protein